LACHSGIGYAVMLKQKEKDLFVNELRLEGFNEFNEFNVFQQVCVNNTVAFSILSHSQLEISAPLGTICTQKSLVISPWTLPATIVMSHFWLSLSWLRKVAMICRMDFSCISLHIEMEQSLKI
jgi:hypothetical protein